jgi:hypothetical protein
VHAGHIARSHGHEGMDTCSTWQVGRQRCTGVLQVLLARLLLKDPDTIYACKVAEDKWDDIYQACSSALTLFVVGGVGGVGDVGFDGGGGGVGSDIVVNVVASIGGNVGGSGRRQVGRHFTGK